MAQQNEQQVSQKGRGRQGCQMDSIGAPRLAADGHETLVSDWLQRGLVLVCHASLQNWKFTLAGEITYCQIFFS